ncbi:nucleotidyltransferase [Kribbella sp. NPDC026611]|uniref:nucleotidyltransferase n=1 Tax=Kribbella sp. NPDC026611 TaxID=3154911 RepID=UPI0033C72B56
MTVTSSGQLGLSSLLTHGLRDLDITEAERNLAIARYTGLGGSFDDHWSSTRGQNIVSPQGSFLLGTVVRNVHRDEGIDIDLVAMRDIARSSTTQEALKADAGVAVSNYQQSPGSGTPALSECSRCFTLTWAEMHLDVLPAIPNGNRPEGGILITDKDVVSWLPSDPNGYATWFRERMLEQLDAERVILAKEMQLDEVPEWRVKTSLQRAVQALKRHRDVFFTGRDDRTASIVITTLAAHAYQGGSDVYEVSRYLISQMGNFLRRVDGRWTLPNPVQSGEDFTDSWTANPGRAAAFFEWLESAQQTFDQLGKNSGLDASVPFLGEVFGDRFAKAAGGGLGAAMYGARQTGSLRSVNGGLLIAGASAAAGSRQVKKHVFAGGSAD